MKCPCSPLGLTDLQSKFKRMFFTHCVDRKHAMWLHDPDAVVVINPKPTQTLVPFSPPAVTCKSASIEIQPRMSLCSCCSKQLATLKCYSIFFFNSTVATVMDSPEIMA